MSALNIVNSTVPDTLKSWSDLKRGNKGSEMNLVSCIYKVRELHVISPNLETTQSAPYEVKNIEMLMLKRLSADSF